MTLSNREKLYEYSLDVTFVKDYGVTLDAIMSWRAVGRSASTPAPE
jgi:hypothetical protein